MKEILQLDYALLDAIAAQLQNALFDVLMPFFSRISAHGELWILLGLLLLCIPGQRKRGLSLWLALLLSVLVCNLLLKNWVARPRPFELREGIELLVRAPGGFSFPSGHTSASFAAAFALFFQRSKLAAPALILAALIAFSRLYLYVHFPTDVLGGILLGLLLGYAATKLFSKAESSLAGRGKGPSSC